MGSRAARAAVCGVMCFGILVGMLVSHAWPLWTGETIFLKVRPVDPRDVFRGDYVVLGYDLNQLNVRAESGGLETRGAVEVRPLGDWWSRLVEQEDRTTGYPGAGWTLRDEVLYVQLEAEPADTPGVDRRYRAVTVSDAPRDGQVNLRGRVRSASWSRPEGVRTLELRMHYGIDALFVPEATGHAIEKAIRDDRPVFAAVAVTSSGQARLKDLIIDGEPLGRRR